MAKLVTVPLAIIPARGGGGSDRGRAPSKPEHPLFSTQNAKQPRRAYVGSPPRAPRQVMSGIRHSSRWQRS